MADQGPNAGTQRDSVDLGGPGPEIPDPEPGPEYSPAKDRERTRGKLALRVLWLLFAVVGGLFVAVISGIRTWTDLEGLSASVLPGVFSIVGTVLGFYFGTVKKADER